MKLAPLLLSSIFAFTGVNTAHAQIAATGGFNFTAPTSTNLTVHPGDSILFSGTFTNQSALEQLDDVTIGLSPGNYGGRFTFASPFSATIGINQSQKFTGTLKISSSATFNPTFFYLDANSIGDSSGENYDFGSSNFKVTLVPAAVPESSTKTSFGLLLILGLGSMILAVRKKTRAAV